MPRGLTEKEIKAQQLPTCPVFKEIGRKYARSSLVPRGSTAIWGWGRRKTRCADRKMLIQDFTFVGPSITIRSACGGKAATAGHWQLAGGLNFCNRGTKVREVRP